MFCYVIKSVHVNKNATIYFDAFKTRSLDLITSTFFFFEETSRNDVTSRRFYDENPVLLRIASIEVKSIPNNQSEYSKLVKLARIIFI